MRLVVNLHVAYARGRHANSLSYARPDHSNYPPSATVLDSSIGGWTGPWLMQDG
jgi:hypothetical protein